MKDISPWTAVVLVIIAAALIMFAIDLIRIAHDLKRERHSAGALHNSDE